MTTIREAMAARARAREDRYNPLSAWTEVFETRDRAREDTRRRVARELREAARQAKREQSIAMFHAQLRVL